MRTLLFFTERQGGDTGFFGEITGFVRRQGGFGADHAFVVDMRTARVSARRRRLRQAARGGTEAVCWEDG